MFLIICVDIVHTWKNCNSFNDVRFKLTSLGLSKFANILHISFDSNLIDIADLTSGLTKDHPLAYIF